MTRSELLRMLERAGEICSNVYIAGDYANHVEDVHVALEQAETAIAVALGALRPLVEPVPLEPPC